MNKKPSSGLVRLQRVTKEKLIDARLLRQNLTPAEAVLWKELRNRNLGNLKFRRQQIVEGFITDFYCEKAKLAIEIDGRIPMEEEIMEADEHREKVFQARGIQTYRIKNEDVLKKLDATLEEIKAVCFSRSRKLNP
jgi:very-short-patch-repair endonuclease